MPQMALEDIGAIEGWRRLWPRIKEEMGGYAAYIGMKIVMAIGAAIVLGIVSAIVFLLFLIPVAGLGAVDEEDRPWRRTHLEPLHHHARGGGGSDCGSSYCSSCRWFGARGVLPLIPSISFAARYPALDALLHPAPPSVVPPPPPDPPPLMPPMPEPIA